MSEIKISAGLVPPENPKGGSLLPPLLASGRYWQSLAFLDSNLCLCHLVGIVSLCFSVPLQGILSLSFSLLFT